MKVEIWSDVVCPWCYVGKRRFDAALARFEHRDDVEVTWRSFELDPSAPSVRVGSYLDHLTAKYRIGAPEAQDMIDRMTEAGATSGVVLRFDKARPGNTFRAHRLLHLAGAKGVQGALKERLMAATFTRGLPIGEIATLEDVGIASGLDADEVRRVLEGDAFSDDVHADERRATALGITSVPYFVVGGTLGVAGAQPSELLLKVLREGWAEAAGSLQSSS